jgi:ferredoxin like protein
MSAVDDEVAALDTMAFEDRMATPRFDVAREAHIKVDTALCGGCSAQKCVQTCPAGLFVPTSDGGIVFNYEQCFECGACYMVCDVEGAISWSYPLGGAGVVFRRT